jgi:Na+/proline symporter
VWAVGAGGFFALPYTILVFSLVFLVMPRLWSVASNHGYVTAADFVKGRFPGRGVRRDRHRCARAGRRDVHRRGKPLHAATWKEFVRPDLSDREEWLIAKIVSLIVKVGALAFVLFLPTQYAIDLQLLGGVWMLQIRPR